MNQRALVLLPIIMIAVSCHSTTFVPGTFGYDFQLLQERDSLIGSGCTH
jgi:hypothetical protein